MYFSKTLVATALLSLLQLGAAAPAAEAAPAAAELEARTSGSLTWYNTGLGACGRTNNDNEYVVALNKAQFDPSTPNGNPNNNSLCGRRVRVKYNGKSVDATLVDRCAGCAWGDLDLSPAAFKVLAPLSVGRMQGTWDYI